MGGRLQVIPEKVFEKSVIGENISNIQSKSKSLRRDWSDVAMRIGIIVSK